MIMESVSLRNWDNKSEVAIFDGSQLANATPNHVGDADGYYKKFLLGESIKVWKQSGEWSVFVDGVSHEIQAIKNCFIYRKGPWVKLEFEIDENMYRFREISFSDFLSRTIDPSYDALDAEELFGIWFKWNVLNERPA